jgi:drug/metabolite transporter (DMT)-like permease
MPISQNMRFHVQFGLVEKRSPWLAQLGLLYCAAIWGSTFFIVKDALNGVDAVVMVGYRFMIAAALLALPLAWRRVNPFKDFKDGLLLGLVLMALYVPQTMGLYVTSASNSAFITGLFVVFTPLLSPLFQRKPTWLEWIAVGLSLLGLYFLAGGIQGMNWGDGITLMAAFTYALHVLLTDRLADDIVDPYRLSFQQFLVIGVASFALAALFGLPFAITTTSAGWTVLFLAIFPTASSFVIQIFGQKHVPPVRTSLIFTLEPVFAVLLAWGVGREAVTVNTILGGVVIVGAMALSAWSASINKA